MDVSRDFFFWSVLNGNTRESTFVVGIEQAHLGKTSSLVLEVLKIAVSLWRGSIFRDLTWPFANKLRPKASGRSFGGVVGPLIIQRRQKNSDGPRKMRQNSIGPQMAPLAKQPESRDTKT